MFALTSSYTVGAVPDRHLQTPPALIVEILSPSTESKDKTSKRDLYEHEGVDYYLIADPAKETLTALELADGRYQARTFDKDVAINLANCQINLHVKQLWA